MTEQDFKKELNWMKRVTKDASKKDLTIRSFWHPKAERFIHGLMEMGNRAEAHNSWNEWSEAMDLCIAWNFKYPNAEIWMDEPYADEAMGDYEAHIEDETFRFTC